MGPEALLVRRILKELNSWPQTRAVKMHGSPYGRRGDPDIWGCRYGQMFLLELKAKGKKPTLTQLKQLGHWARVGATAGCFDDYEKAIACVGSIQPARNKPDD